jgi:phage shock protein C
MSGAKRVYRKPSEGKLTGVCAGLADYFEVDVTLVRLAFVVTALATGGIALLAYIAAAVIIPSKEAPLTKAKINKKSAEAANTNDFSANFQQLAEDFKANNGEKNLRNWLGFLLIFFGAWLLVVQFLPGWLMLNWRIVWPAVLILVGVSILLNKRSS